MPRNYIPRSDSAYRSPKKASTPQKRKKTPPSSPPHSATRTRIMSILGMVLLLMVVAGALWGVSRWNYLEVTSVEVVGVDRLDPSRIEEIIETSLSSNVNTWWNSNNLLLILETEITTRIQDQEPSVSSVKILRKFPDTVIAIVEERYPVFQLCSPDNCLLLANDGIVIDMAEGGNLIPIRRQVSSEVGDQVYSKRTMDWLENLVRSYSIDVGLSIKEIEVSLEGESGILEIAVMTADGYPIRFDFETDIITQKNALQAVFASDIPEERRSNLEYIDLRIPNRVYYRFRSESSEVPESSN